MPKVKQSDGVRIRNMIQELGSNVLCVGSDDNSVLKCKPCNITLNYSRKSNIATRIKTSKHIRNVGGGSGNPENAQDHDSNNKSPESFNLDQCHVQIFLYGS